MPSFPPPAGEHPLRGRVLDALLDAGMMPTIDEDGDVAVKLQDQSLFVRCVDSQPPMMRVFGLWKIDLGENVDELTALRAANAVTGALNLVKATIHEDRLSVAVDLLVGIDTDLSSLLTATLDAVLGSVHSWHRTVMAMLHPDEVDDWDDDEDGWGPLD
jgi:hypothetical protein